MTESAAVAFQWNPSSFSGWGVYGLNLLLNWSRRQDLTVACSAPINLKQLDLDPLELLQLQPVLQRSEHLCRDLAAHAGRPLQAPFAVLHSLTAEFEPAPAAHEVRLSGTPSIGVVFTEKTVFSAAERARAQAYPLIVAGSRWNRDALQAAGVAEVALVMQGIDPTHFHPAPRAGVFGGRFVIFAGGKPEKRKGQDLVVRAFRSFAARHPDALLMTAWGSPWPELAATLNERPGISPLALTQDGTVDMLAWTVANGIPAHQVLHFEPMPNALMARILREADVALFTSRAEGGTNLVAMEAMACGLPTILSANTGHLDLIEGGNCYPLRRQNPIHEPGCEGWGDSDPEEIVETLEEIYRNRDEAAARGRRAAAEIGQLTWARQLDRLAEIIRPHLGRA